MLTAQIKFYLCLGLLVALVSGVFAWSYHERSVEHSKDVAAMTRVVNAEAKQHTAETALTQLKLDSAGKVYETTRTALVVDPPHLVCIIPGTPKLPAVGGDSGESDDSANLRAAATFDPGPDAIQVGHEANAQVIGLEALVLDLQSRLAQK